MHIEMEHENENGNNGENKEKLPYQKNDCKMKSHLSINFISSN